MTRSSGRSVQGTGLVAFALPEEANPFRRLRRGGAPCEILVTGMGPVRARVVMEAELARWRPAWVMTCGFAGALDPALRNSDVVWRASSDFPRARRLGELGGREARFHLTERILVTGEAKRVVRRATGADAVEMESAVIEKVCLEAGVPSATVRVISDTAREDLPMDFNRFLRPDCSLAMVPLIGAIVRAPGTIPRLLAFRRQTRAAAEALAQFLVRLLISDQ